MFPIPFNFPFRKSNGDVTTIADAISSGGGGYTLPTASANTKGGVKIGAGLTMTGEVLSNDNPTPYSLPTASAETLGGVKVGSGLTITDGVLSASGGGGGFSPTSGQITVGSGMNTPTVNQLYKFGNMVCIEFIGSVNTSDGVVTVTVGDLPEGFQPSTVINIPCIVKSGLAVFYDAYISITSWSGAYKAVKCNLPSDLIDAGKKFDNIFISGIFTL